MERDEVYVPRTRSDLGIPHLPTQEIDWEDYFGDTPIYTLFMLIRQQLLAFPSYLCEYHQRLPSNLQRLTYLAVFNVSGQKDYPPGTNHFNRKYIKCLDVTGR